jgi:hypothetical protein
LKAVSRTPGGVGGDFEAPERVTADDIADANGLVSQAGVAALSACARPVGTA